MPDARRVLVTGGGTFLGDAIAAALVAEGADVSLLVRPGAEEDFAARGALAGRTRWFAADVWDPASLKGRGRGQQVVVHTVGSLKDDPAHGLSFHTLNFLSARNVANMCVSGGVPHMVLMSAVRAPWVNAQYIAAKREAEVYLDRVGLRRTIVRAPLAYLRGARRALPFVLMTALGSVPPTAWFGFGRIAPMPLDVLARGAARIALDPPGTKTIYYAPDLRRRNSRAELRQSLASALDDDSTLMRAALDPTLPAPSPYRWVGEDTPFGWTPPRE